MKFTMFCQELCSFVSYGCKVLDDKNQLLRSKFADALTLILINGKVGRNKSCHQNQS